MEPNKQLKSYNVFYNKVIVSEKDEIFIILLKEYMTTKSQNKGYAWF